MLKTLLMIVIKLQMLIKNNLRYSVRVIAEMLKLEIPYYELLLRND